MLVVFLRRCLSLSIDIISQEYSWLFSVHIICYVYEFKADARIICCVYELSRCMFCCKM